MQGCLLSMLFYAFYNVLLICIANSSNKSELASGFVDDVMFLAISKSLMETHMIIKDLIECIQGTFDWSTLHNSPFELSKLALMNFLCSHFDTILSKPALQCSNPNGSVTMQVVNTVKEFKYLSVIFNSRLHWSAHTQKVTASTTWWTIQIARLFCISGGMPPHHICQLYNTVVVLAFTYAADIWYTSIQRQRHSGSVAVMKELLSVQQRAAKIVTGVLSTAAALVTAQQIHNYATMVVYCNGSGFEGGIGALTMLYIDSEETSSLKYHLSLDTEHTIYEAKVKGLSLGLYLLSSFNHQLWGLIALGSNSQASICVLTNQCPHLAHYLLDQVYTAAEKLHRKQDCLCSTSSRCTMQGMDTTKQLHT
ncbi:hypothetical protein J132_04803 [Termitomyces sp. J132]|nr:hypothetical protein J132_04803 [Termitomyces sp. J132]